MHHRASPVNGEALANVGEFLANHGVEPALVGQDGLELGDDASQLGQFLVELGPAQAGQASQGQIEDVVGLDLGELEALTHQGGACARAVG